MLIVKIEGKTTIESALKTLKSKFIKTKMARELNERKTFTKKSIKRRDEIKKATYLQKIKSGKQD